MVRVPSSVSCTAPVSTPAYRHVPFSWSADGRGSVDLRHADSDNGMAIARSATGLDHPRRDVRINDSPSASMFSGPECYPDRSYWMAASTSELDGDPA